MGSFHSTKLAFCIEACILENLQVRSNAPQSALDAVRVFYTYITKYQQLGIPYGRARKALWPLMTKRLAEELDGLGACDQDYYRRYGEILRANTYKPATPWLEEGLFTGPNDAATPRIFEFLAVELSEKTASMLNSDSQLGRPNPPLDHYEGVVTAILENDRWVIDDYVAMYENDELRRLSAGYPQCKSGQWVGEPPTERPFAILDGVLGVSPPIRNIPPPPKTRHHFHAPASSLSDPINPQEFHASPPTTLRNNSVAPTRSP